VMPTHPLALTGFFSRQVFRDVIFRQRAESLTRAIHTLVMDGLWRNFEVGKAFETACMHVGQNWTCDLDGHNGNGLTIFDRK
jgi:hypothetical protein